MRGFCPFASGSKGNCLYFGSEHTKLLIDAGISYASLQKRLFQIGVEVTEIDAVLISHEHSDHIRGLEVLTSKLDLPVFANGETAKAISAILKVTPRFKIFSTGETFEFGEITIHPFSVSHDTVDPVGFTLEYNGMKLGICSDIGMVTTLVTSRLKNCDYLYIEANHEPSMVYASSRPPIYKQRVLGRQGHLSNDMCVALLKEIYHPNLKHIYLAHLSSECNHPDLLLKKIHQELKSPTLSISIAYQDKISKQIHFEPAHKNPFAN